MARRTNNQSTPQRAIARAGFSMMDLMVSIAVIAILIAILLPALGSAMESARRVTCQAQLREIGIALQGYVTDNLEELPNTVHANTRTANGVLYEQPEQTIFIRLEESNSILRRTDGWDGLGLLFNSHRSAPYLTTPEIMYCPSHAGDHKFEDYSSAWRAQEGIVASNYQYRLPFDGMSVHQLDSAMALVSDGLREKSDYNHKVGNNLIKADLHVSWYNDTTEKVYDELVDDVTHLGANADARDAVFAAWGHLDLDPRRPVSNPVHPRDHDDDNIFAGIAAPSHRN